MVYIIGVGPGDERYLTDYARDLILDAGAVVTSDRLWEQMWHLNPNTVAAATAELADVALEILEEQSNVCILVPGDVGFCGASGMLAQTFVEAAVEFECISGLSYLQYLANALRLPYDNVVNVNMQNGRRCVTPYVCYNPKVFVSADIDYGARAVIEQLTQAGLGMVKVSVGENLGAENERIVTGTAQTLLQKTFEEFAVLLLENENFVDCMAAINDAEYAGDMPVLNQYARRLALAELKITPDDVLADVGAGNGAASVEAARLAHRGEVFAIEKNETAAANAKRNIARFGAYNVTLISAENAPVGLKKLPLVSKALVSGTVGNLSEIINLLLQNNPAIKLVISAYDLSTLNEALQVLEACGLTASVVCVNIAVSEKGDSRNLMRAQNPVYLISAAK